MSHSGAPFCHGQSQNLRLKRADNRHLCLICQTPGRSPTRPLRMTRPRTRHINRQSPTHSAHQVARSCRQEAGVRLPGRKPLRRHIVGPLPCSHSTGEKAQLRWRNRWPILILAPVAEPVTQPWNASCRRQKGLVWRGCSCASSGHHDGQSAGHSLPPGRDAACLRYNEPSASCCQMAVPAPCPSPAPDRQTAGPQDAQPCGA